MKQYLLTLLLAIAMLPLAAQNPESKDSVILFGRNLTDYMSKPKVGGYLIGSYKYSDLDTAHDGDGFNTRLVRAYIDGSIFGDFNYRIQVEFNKTVHLKDAFIEWTRFKEFKVKFGQYKRAFTFENPYNPWDVGVGDYSQLVKKLAGFSDYTATEYNGSNGGRDIGLQFQGDIVPVGRDKHRLFHYQLAIYNGQGINIADANSEKDFIGTLQVQPVKDLYIGLFGWKGSYTANGITVDRNRYSLGAKYEHNGWSARAEYAHHQGQNIADASADRADAWYVTMGVPVTRWLKIYGKYDVYRDGADFDGMKSIYTLSPNIQLHKNLMLQVQYNHVDDRSLDKHYNELWAQAYIRFNL